MNETCSVIVETAVKQIRHNTERALQEIDTKQGDILEILFNAAQRNLAVSNFAKELLTKFGGEQEHWRVIEYVNYSRSHLADRFRTCMEYIEEE